MKKILAIAAALVMLFTAAAETAIPFAGMGADVRAMSVQKGFSVNEDGSFVCKTVETGALEALFYEKVPNYAGGGMVYMYVSLEGNLNTGIVWPCLNILYAGANALDADYVMLNAGGVRYDIAVASSVKQSGRYKVETLKAFLNEDGLRLVNTLSECTDAMLTILGRDQYTQKLDAGAYYGNQKNELAGKSLSALKMPVGAPDFAAYGLSDLALTAFEEKYGIETYFAAADPAAQCAFATDKNFGLIADGSNANAIRDMQELLVEKGFMAGAVSTVVTAGMIEGVKAAQIYFDLPATGYADAKLVSLLSEEVLSPVCEEEKAEEKCEYQVVNEDVSIRIDRWWNALRADTTLGGGSVSVSNKDNVLFVLDGSICSTAIKNLSLSWEITGELIYEDKWAFPASLYAETQAGEAFSASLGILSESRLVIVCEVPEGASEGDGEWELVIRTGADEYRFVLQK